MRVRLVIGNVVVMIRDVLEDKATKSHIASVPRFASGVRVRRFIRSWNSSIEIEAETALVTDIAKSSVPFLPIALPPSSYRSTGQPQSELNVKGWITILAGGKVRACPPASGGAVVVAVKVAGSDMRDN